MMLAASARRQARAQAKQEQMLDAAQRLFLEQGYAAASTDAIAAAAGVSKQTLYAYFPSKDDLLIAVLRRLVAPEDLDDMALFGLGRAPVDRDELRRDLIAVSETTIARMMQPEYLALLRVIISEAPRQPRLAELFRATVPERGLRAITGLLARAVESGAAAAIDLDAAARLFVGALLSYALLDGLLVVDGPPRPPAPERLAAIVDTVLPALTSPNPGSYAK